MNISDINNYSHEILQSCIEELRNTSQEDFNKRVSDLQLKEKYYDKVYPQFDAIPLEIQITSTWYKYPEYKPTDNDDDDKPYGEYEVFWRWDDDSILNNKFMSHVFWMDNMWQEYDGFNWYREFENPQHKSAKNYRRIVIYWRRVEYPDVILFD